jgi:hypothetical protein
MPRHQQVIDLLLQLHDVLYPDHELPRHQQVIDLLLQLHDVLYLYYALPRLLQLIDLLSFGACEAHAFHFLLKGYSKYIYINI